MKIYIASSWKHKHGVEMLTSLLRANDHEVVSWIENCNLEGSEKFVFEEWVNTKEADDCFKFDIDGATTCDLLIYYGASGMDACCELGAAWSKGIEIIGLYSKGESLGLMRKMISTWFDDYRNVLGKVQEKQAQLNTKIKKFIKPKNVQISLDYNGTDKIQQGSFVCKQCAIGQVMNTNCIYILNTIGNSIQCCENCGYDNYFDVSDIAKTKPNEEH